MTSPSVSIVLPVRNEADGITRTLEACLAQDYDGDLEVVVADGMSTDGTRPILERYRTRGVRVVDNPSGTTPAGLNAAIDASTGDIVVRCDGHAILPPGYVTRVIETLRATGAGNVGGIQRAIGSTAVQRGIASAMSSVLGVGDARFHRGGDPGPVDTVYLGAFPREVLVEVGGYDEGLARNQDYELNIRIREAGHVVWFDPGLEVAYTPRSSFGGLWRQYRDYGAWKRTVVRKHPGSLRARQVGPPVLVIGLVASGILLVTPWRVLGMVPLAAYAASLGVAGATQAVRTGDAASLLAAPAIAVMHVAWGVGFLTGRR